MDWLLFQESRLDVYSISLGWDKLSSPPSSFLQLVKRSGRITGHFLCSNLSSLNFPDLTINNKPASPAVTSTKWQQWLFSGSWWKYLGLCWVLHSFICHTCQLANVAVQNLALISFATTTLEQAPIISHLENIAVAFLLSVGLYCC